MFILLLFISSEFNRKHLIKTDLFSNFIMIADVMQSRNTQCDTKIKLQYHNTVYVLPKPWSGTNHVDMNWNTVTISVYTKFTGFVDSQRDSSKTNPKAVDIHIYIQVNLTLIYMYMHKLTLIYRHVFIYMYKITLIHRHAFIYMYKITFIYRHRLLCKHILTKLAFT